MRIFRWQQTCCDGRRPCARRSVREAVTHAEQRSRRSGRDQSARWIDGAWRITESGSRPRRRSAV